MKRFIPIWTIPLVVVFAIATVWLRLSIVKTTYSINQTEKMISNAKHDREKSSLKMAGLKSPRRLEAISKARFKLQPPQAEQVVYLK